MSYEFKWCKLKIHLIPLIIQEIDFISDKYLQVLRELLKMNKSELKIAVNEIINIENNPQAEFYNENICLYVYYRRIMTERCCELEDFYESNFGEENIECVEVGRLKLIRILWYDVDSILRLNDENEISEENNINTYTYNCEVKDEMRNEKEKSGIKFNLTNEKGESRNKNQNQKESNEKSNTKLNKTINNTIVNSTYMNQVKGSINTKSLSMYDQFSQNNQFIQNDLVSSRNNQAKGWVSINFKVIMNEDEYKMLMIRKANKNSYL